MDTKVKEMAEETTEAVVEAPEAEPAAVEVPKAEPAPTETAETEEALLENAEAETALPEASEAESAPAETAGAEAAKAPETESAPAETAAAEPIAQEAPETEPAVVESAAAEPAPTEPVVTETMQDYAKELEASFRKINEGDIIKGTVIHVGEESVILDLRYYAQGIIKAENLSNDPDYLSSGQIAVGDEVEATVVRVDDGEGNIELSKKEANDVLVWGKFKNLMEQETIVKVRLRESVKGGMVTFLEGIRAFIPASQLAADYVEDLDSWIGKEIEARVITVDQEKKKVVLSGKSVAREKEAEARRHKVAMMAPGAVMEGVVESLMPYGAFVSLGDGISGLVHISQISQRRIKKPSEVLKVGQKVQVKILNTDNDKVSLSMKALEEIMEKEEEDRAPQDYASGENVGTSLGDLLARLKL